MTEEMNKCAGLSSSCTSIFRMNASCVSKCINQNYHISETCASHFGDLGKCGFDNCKSACISGDPTNKNCVTCNEKKCSPAFHAATGFVTDCKYYKECNGPTLDVSYLL